MKHFSMEDADTSAFSSLENLREQNFTENIYPESFELSTNYKLS